MIRTWIIGSVAALVLSLAAGARADSLRDALADAYRFNQAIVAERAAVRGKDENVPQARANLFIPHITVSGGATTTSTHDAQTAKFEGVEQTQDQDRIIDDGVAQLDIAITLYDGGNTPAQIRYAKGLIEVERGVLMNTEQQVFLSAAQAYAQIVLSVLLQKLATEQTSDIKRIADEAHRALPAHLVTVTDVAQVDAQLASAQSDYQQATGNLLAGREQLQAVIGRPPGDIAGWPALPVPPGLDDAETTVLGENPQLASARSQVIANEAAVDAAESAPFPTLSFVASATKDFNGTRYTAGGPSSILPATPLGASLLSPLPNMVTVHPLSGVIGFKLNWPLYQGGGEYAVIRQREDAVVQARATLDDMTRGLLGTVRGYWDSLAAADAQVATTGAQVKSANQALEGIERQFYDGNSTIIDVIQLRQRLNTAVQSYDQAQYNAFIDTIQVLVAMGRFNAKSLDLPVALYDPGEHYRSVRHKLFGRDDEN